MFGKKKKHGCLTGCLLRILLTLGLAALLFVLACQFGFIVIDTDTGKPTFTMDGMGNVVQAASSVDLSGFTPDSWPYGMSAKGLTVKTLRGGAILVCADGYTVMLNSGAGVGIVPAGQALLCGVRKLNAVVALGSDAQSIGGMAMVMKLLKPDYLFYPDSQTKTTAFQNMLAEGQQQGMNLFPGEQGMNFTLGQARITFIGPTRKMHTDDRDDGLSLRIDYGSTCVLVMGGVTVLGEGEIVEKNANLRADVLIAAQGGGMEATGKTLIEAVAPTYALLTGETYADDVRGRLESAGVSVYTAAENGIMTVISDGNQVIVKP